MSANIREKIEKILRLAERGVGGEKVNARHQLNKLLMKYDITMDEIKKPEKALYWFKPRGQYEKELLLQCFAVVVNTSKPSQYKRPREKGYELTPRHYLELRSMYEYYKRRWEKDVHVFFLAFIKKQELYPETMPKNPKTSFSESELKLQREASLMSMGIKKGNYVSTRNRIEGEEREPI